MKFYISRGLIHLCILFAFCHFVSMPPLSAGPIPGEPVEISVTRFYDPNKPQGAVTSRLIELMKDNPDIEIKQWGGIELPGGGAKASLMMAIAGKTAPDIGEAWFHIIRSEIRNGFFYPLNEWIGDDLNGDGYIDDNEAKWEPWKKIPPLWRRVATQDGKIYGIPQAPTYRMGVVFRTDLVRAAGLNPNHPPKTWEEFWDWCYALTDPAKDVPGAKTAEGQKGIALNPYGWQWLPWIQTCGGNPIIQIKTSPKTGKKYEFAPDAVSFITPEGEDLALTPSEWKADFTSKESIQAAKLYHDIIWRKWIVDPITGKPIELQAKDIQALSVTHLGKDIPFRQEDIITGVGRAQTNQRGQGSFDFLARGEVAMVSAFVQDLNGVGSSTGIDPDLLSWFPFPKGEGENATQAIQFQNHYAVMYEGVKDRPKHERDLIWKTLEATRDQKVRDNAVREKVLSGLARFADPLDLERLGYQEYLQDIPETIRENFKNIKSGQVAVKTEPFMGFWFTVDQALDREVLSLIISQSGENFDYKVGLTEVERKANSGMMFEMSEEEIDEYRPYARIAISVVAVIFFVLVFLIVKEHLKKGKDKIGSTSNVYNKWLAWGLVLPAIILIGLWSYYPLAKGMIMAFQDYKINGETEFVGLKNFIILFLDTSFWMSILRTCYFVFLNMLLAFTAPILLAVLLTDVPRFKILFRTLFFLPQMTSGLVIALLWKLMYNPTPQGFFNQLLSYVNALPFVEISSQQWLQDPSLAMICVVIPTVWASMGMSSLIYIAAISSIPSDMYEAAEIDGATIFHKFKSITIPSILPLIIINFVGAFIGTFQNMGNIFLLTFGGPGESTTVVGLKIWIEAYANLRFSMATSMAWILGSLLIGFTYFQIKFLGKIEYKRAK